MMTSLPPSSPQSRTRIDSFRYAFSGLRHAFRTQPNVRIHTVITFGIVLLGIYLHLSKIEWALILGAIGLVWATELINTAIETVVDLASPQIHPLAKIAKDVAAAAVLIGVFIAVSIGALILGPPLFALVSRGCPQ